MSSPVGVQVAPQAKNVLVFRNGDPFHFGRKIVVNEKQFLTFEAFLNEVTNCIQAPVAVRNIYTPRNGHRITHLGDLRNKGEYVAGGTEKFRRLDYLHTGVKQSDVLKQRDIYQVPANLNFIERWRKDLQLPCVIHVFRNGDLMTPPFRVLLSPVILKEWELILSLLTKKANLYSGAVRKLCTLDGVSLFSGAELVSGEYYVAVGSEKYKCLPYQELLTVHGERGNAGAKHKINKAGVGKVHSVSQEGYSNSVLTESPTQVDSRRVHSTGTDEKILIGPKNPGRRGEDESVFYAKPVRVHPKRKPKPGQEDNTVKGVFKVKEVRHELEGAQEVREDTHTHVELPVDQRVAEVIQEEYDDNRIVHNAEGESNPPSERKK